MKTDFSKKMIIVILVMFALVLSMPAIASHTFQPDTNINTTDSDKWSLANSTELINIFINVSNSSTDYLNQTNITVPVNGTNVTYIINWSSLTVPINWTCANETVSGNVSKIICDTTVGNETQIFNISFLAEATDLDDSYQGWTINTTDNNSYVNSTNLITAIGIPPTLSSSVPVNGTVMRNFYETFLVNVTDTNLNLTSGLMFFRNASSPTWKNQSLNCVGSGDSYNCSTLVNIAGWDGQTVEYYYSMADTYGGVGYNWTSTSYLNVTVNLTEVSPSPYIIFIPLESSTYYNVSYNAVGLNMNDTINNNSYVYTDVIDKPHYYSIPQRARIVYFDENIDDSLASIVSAYEGEYVTVILHPEHITPDLIRKFNRLFSNVNSDAFVDVSWGIVTGKYPEDAQALVDRSLGTVGLNSTTYYNYYEPDAMSFTGSSVFAPLEAAYIAMAGIVNNLLDVVGVSNVYTGTDVSADNLFSSLDNADSPNIIYFAGSGTSEKLYINSTDYVNGLNKCPFYESVNDSIECQGSGIFSNVSFKNRLVFISTSDYFGRLESNDTNSSVWDINNANANKWDYKKSLALNMLSNTPTNDGPLAFIGPVTSSWITTEHFAKTFFLQMLNDNNLGSALATSKNILRLNRDNVTNQTTKDFITYIDDSYVLYGVPQVKSNKQVSQIDYIIQSIEQIDSNPTTDSPISWNMTVSISPKTAISPIYFNNSWQSTKGNIWFHNVTEPTNGKINVSFVSALSDEYSPDSSAYNITIVDISTMQNTITQMTVEIEKTQMSSHTEQYNQSTTFLSANSISEDDFKYTLKNNRSIIFAMIYSANESLSASYTKTINLTFNTESVTTETLSVEGQGNIQSQNENNITIKLNIINPTNQTITNLALKYPVPTGVLSCNVYGININGTCLNSTGFILQNISYVLPGKTNYTINYITDANMTNSTKIIYDNGFNHTDKIKYNWGDNVSIISNIATASVFNAEIVTEIIYLKNTSDHYVVPVDENSIIWTNTTIVTLDGTPTIIEPVWTIPSNTSESQSGEYLIKTYVLENTTSDYLLKNIIYINITDELNVSVTISNVSSTTQEGYISSGPLNLTVTGSVQKQSGEYLNGSLIGIASISAELDGTPQGSSWQVSPNGNIPSMDLNINVLTGEHNLTVKVSDEFNNTGTYIYPLKVSNEIESITVGTNTTVANTANEDEYIQIKGIVKGNGSTVFNATISVYVDGNKICDNLSVSDGSYSCDWLVPKGADEKNYQISVDATSPMNLTKTISNSTTLKVLWLEVTFDSVIADIGTTVATEFSKNITVVGDVKYQNEENDTLVNSATILCNIKHPNNINYNYTGTAVDEYGKFSCPFTNLNVTGRYMVTIYATQDIVSDSGSYNGVTGSTYQKFDIIYTAPYTPPSSSSGGGSVYLPPSTSSDDNDTTDSADTTDTTKYLNLSYNKIVTIKQGATETITITVTNNHNETIHDLNLSLTGMSWLSDYSISELPVSELLSGASTTIIINATVPVDADILKHSIDAQFIANETEIDETIQFTIEVALSSENTDTTISKLTKTENVLSTYNDRVNDLLSNISGQGVLQKYFNNLNGTSIGTAKDLIFEAKKLILESKSFLEAGNAIEALKAQHKADLAMRDAELIISTEEDKLKTFSKIVTKVLVVIGFFVLLISLLGYMLMPAKPKSDYVPKDDFFHQKINKNISPFKSLKEKIRKPKNKSIPQTNVGPIGRHKINELNDRFKSYKREDD